MQNLILPLTNSLFPLEEEKIVNIEKAKCPDSKGKAKKPQIIKRKCLVQGNIFVKDRITSKDIQKENIPVVTKEYRDVSEQDLINSFAVILKKDFVNISTIPTKFTPSKKKSKIQIGKLFTKLESEYYQVRKYNNRKKPKVGQNYQCEIPRCKEILAIPPSTAFEKEKWNPNKLSEDEVTKYLKIIKELTLFSISLPYDEEKSLQNLHLNHYSTRLAINNIKEEIIKENKVNSAERMPKEVKLN